MPIIARQCKQKQATLPRPTMSSTIFYSSLCLQSERINRNLPGQKTYSRHTTTSSSYACIIDGDARRTSLYFELITINPYYSSLRVLSRTNNVIHAWMRRPGVLPGAWSSWHLQVASCTKLWTSVLFTFYSNWASEAWTARIMSYDTLFVDYKLHLFLLH